MRLKDYASREELKRLASVFMTVVVGLFTVALFEFIVVPSLRVRNLPISTPTIPAGQSGWLDPTEYPPSRSYTPPPVDLKSVLEPTPQLLGQGLELFGKNCAQCHGADGTGRGPAAATLTPPPRNFTQARGWKHGSGLADIFKTVSQGVAGSAMASFDYLPAKERMALAHYVQSLGRFPHPAQPQALAALEQEFVGHPVPNRIPVSLAMRKLAEEYELPQPLVLTGTSARVLADPQRAAIWLRNSTAWRAGPKALAEAVSAQAPDNGFAVAAAGLPPVQWSALYAELPKR